jgi:peptidoglycan/LPS O-acetylase OafA/YrhL
MAFDHQSSRLPGLDGLRGISILLVIMCHSVWYRHLHLSDKTAETLNEITKPLGLFGVPVFS